MDQRIVNLCDECTHAPLTRQDFLKRLPRLVGSAALVATANVGPV